MYAISDVERRLLAELWGRINEKWLGPTYDEYCADNADDIEAIESLQTKRLIDLEAVNGRNAVRNRDTFDHGCLLSLHPRSTHSAVTTAVTGLS